MPDLVCGTSSFQRDRGNLPELPVINMIAENAPTEPVATLQSRPGLETSAITLGAGPVRGMFQIDGVLSDELFSVSGTSLYAATVDVGTVTGAGPVSFGGYEDMVFVNAGADIHSYDGGSFDTVAFPDSADVTRICVAASRLVAIKADGGRLYWSNTLTGTVEALSFATAEKSPDLLRDMVFVGDVLVLLGAETVEFWPVADDSDLPFQPMIGRVFPVGIRATGCVAKYADSFAWVTNDNQICLGTPENVISYPGLQVLIEESASASLWTFRLDGEEFLALRLDDSTWVWTKGTGLWSQMQSYGYDNWLPQAYEAGYFGSSEDGVLLQWSDQQYDLGGVLERSFRAWLPITNAPTSVFNLTVRTNPGRTTVLTGDYSDPQIEIRTSMDGGATWSDWMSRSLGGAGKYRSRTQWTSLGLFGYPGLMVEVRVVDPVPFRASGITINEPFGGI